MHDYTTNLVHIAAVLVVTMYVYIAAMLVPNMYYAYFQKDGTNATAAKDRKKKTESNHEEVASINDDPNGSGMVIKEEDCHEKNAGVYCCSVKLFILIFLLLFAIIPSESESSMRLDRVAERDKLVRKLLMIMYILDEVGAFVTRFLFPLLLRIGYWLCGFQFVKDLVRLFIWWCIVRQIPSIYRWCRDVHYEDLWRNEKYVLWRDRYLTAKEFFVSSPDKIMNEDHNVVAAEDPPPPVVVVLRRSARIREQMLGHSEK